MGPLFFLIYINDLPTVSHIFNMLMYADDTTLYCNFSENVSSDIINFELNKVYDWLTSNKLSLNVKKTKYMVFHTSQRIINYPPLKINNIQIDRVTQFNFLGLIIESNLKWKCHMNHISIKISRILGLMYRLKYIYPQSVLHLLYNTLIASHFNYCILVWGAKLVKDHPLHMLQKRAVRTITNSEYLAHSEPLCKQLNIVKLPDIFHFAVWKFYFKLIKNELPCYFDIMKPVNPIACNNYAIRKPCYHLPKISHSFAEQLMEYQLVLLLNSSKVQHSICIKRTNSLICRLQIIC